MNKDIRITPVGLKGNAITERVKELMDIKPINENKNTISVELTKIGPDGNVYAIIKENHNHYIKITENKETILSEDFKYIGGLKNKQLECYSSYAKAIKTLNMKFKMLAEKHNYDGDINVFSDDKLITENTIVGFANYTDNGFANENEIKDEESSVIEEETDDLSDEEKAIDAMRDADEEKPLENIMEQKNSIFRAMLNIDKLIDGLSEPTIKKKV